VKAVLAATLLAVVLLMGVAEAVTVVGGVGTEACASWIVARRDHQAFGYEQWLLGYLSGVGDVHTARLDPLNGIAVDEIWAWVDHYCQAHPLDHIVRAGEAFVDTHPQ
jgi:hypothetical protein